MFYLGALGTCRLKDGQGTAVRPSGGQRIPDSLFGTQREGPRTPSHRSQGRTIARRSCEQGPGGPLPGLHEPNRKTLHRLEKQTQKLTMPALNNELLPPSGRGPTPKCLSELTHHSPPPEGGGNNCSICSIQAVTWMDRTWAGSSILLLIDQQLHVSNPTKPGGCCGVDTHCREQTQLGP